MDGTLPPGVTIDELKLYLGGPFQAAADEVLLLLLEGVVEYCAGHTGRQLTPNPPADTDPEVTLTIRADGRRWVRVPDAREISAVIVDGTTLTTDDFEQITGGRGDTIVHLRLATCGDVVQVIGRFGFDKVPAELRDAMYAHAARNYRERDAMYADQVQDETGAVLNFFRRLPPRVQLTYDAWRVASDRWGLE